MKLNFTGEEPITSDNLENKSNKKEHIIMNSDTIGSHKTSVINDDNQLLVAYHSTIVVKVVNNQYVILKSGGWLTNTTKRRMNQASNEYRLNYRVFQKGWSWFVETPEGVVDYYEGMIIDKFSGRILNSLPC